MLTDKGKTDFHGPGAARSKTAVPLGRGGWGEAISAELDLCGVHLAVRELRLELVPDLFLSCKRTPQAFSKKVFGGLQ